MTGTDLVRIATTAGTTYYSPSEPVLTKAGSAADGRPVYVLQPAGQLKPGQQVAWDRQYVNVTLEQIARDLTTEPTYAAAQAATFITNSKGELVPRFRDFLISGLHRLAQDGNKALAQLSKINEIELESMIAKDGKDFPAGYYRTMADEVHKYIRAYSEVEGAPFVTRDTVINWLTGETIGPRDRDILSGLKELNPDFKAYEEPANGERNLWDSYKIWVVVRQGLRSYFASVKENGSGKKPRQIRDDHYEEKGHITLTPFLRHLLNKFYEEVSEKHVNVLVTGVKPVLVDDTVSGQSVRELIADMEKGGPEPHLYRGLCRERPEDMNAFVVPRESIATTLTLISDAMQFGLRRYLRVPEIKRQLDQIIRDNGGEFKSHQHNLLPNDEIILVLSHYVIGPLNRELMENYAKRGATDALIVKQMGDLLLQQAFEGRMDAAIGLPQGAVATVISAAETLQTLIADAYLQVEINKVRIANERKWLEMIDEKRVKYAPKGFFGRFYSKLSGANSLFKKAETETRQEIERLEAANRDLEGKVDFDYSRTKKETLVGVAIAYAAQFGLPLEQIYGDSEVIEFSTYVRIVEGRTSKYVPYDEARTLFEGVGLSRQFLSLIPTNLFIDKIKIRGIVRQRAKQALKENKSGKA